MFRQMTCVAVAATAWMVAPVQASGMDLEGLRAEINKLRESYEARIASLEKRLADAETQTKRTEERVNQAATQAAPATANSFNPQVSLILSGTYAHSKLNPETYKITGFVPSGGEVGPPKRSFSLAESELVMSANIDTDWHGKLTLALEPDNKVKVEEAWIQSLNLPRGLTLKAGRHFSGIGYVNEQHGHAWDFADMPLPQKAFLGNQYGQDGVQLKWVAPTDMFVELGAELGRGHQFPGADREKNGIGSNALFAHVGGDVGASHSWRGGVSYLQNKPKGREFSDNDKKNKFTGDSNLWLADFVWKWAPDGNAKQRNFKFQTEYYRRTENGNLTHDTEGTPVTDVLRTKQSGWYAQGVYQFMPKWRVGARYDKLAHGSLNLGSSIALTNIPVLSAHDPKRSTVMLDYASSEFSRFRLQFARDHSRLNQPDNQLMLQYVMSLGAHGAHKF